MTNEAFLILHPELASVAMSAEGEALITASIATATPEVGEMFRECGMADRALALRAAHYIALSPYGINARLVSDASQTTYGVQFRELLSACTAGLRMF